MVRQSASTTLGIAFAFSDEKPDEYWETITPGKMATQIAKYRQEVAKQKAKSSIDKLKEQAARSGRWQR